MRVARALRASAVMVFLAIGVARLSALRDERGTIARATRSTPMVAVGPQYDSTHVYVAPKNFGRFVASILATFGGSAGKPGVFTVTPTPSRTMSQVVMTPVGIFSVFGYETPIPYPFGSERTGYLVTRIDEAIDAARQSGADVIVSPFRDLIGRDAIIEWPGGVCTQLYWHTKAPDYPPLKTVPENRVYVSPDAANAFVRSYLAFSLGTVVSDDANAPGIEIGRPADVYRRVRIDSKFGKLTALVTDGHLPFPYGREMTGYEVVNLEAALAKAQASGASVIIPPYVADHRDAAFVEFPGGFIAELHSSR
jgi:hypothetical protein